MPLFTRYDGIGKAVEEFRRSGFVGFSGYDCMAPHMAEEVVSSVSGGSAQIGVMLMPHGGRWVYVYDTSKYVNAEAPDLVERLMAMDALL